MTNIEMKQRIVDYVSGIVFGYGFGMVTGYYLL
jgi:F0F1-type ATP synthase assembly protein I